MARKFDEFLGAVAEALPTGWRFEISCSNGDVSFALHDPEWEDVAGEVMTESDMHILEQIVEHVRFARESGGLQTEAGD